MTYDIDHNRHTVWINMIALVGTYNKQKTLVRGLFRAL